MGSESAVAGPRRRLEGKVVFITGVAKLNSIGFATAIVCGEEGATLAIADISEKTHHCAEELCARGIVATSHTADLTKGDDVRRLADEILAEHGRIDVLVNNAGMAICGQEEDFTDFARLTEAQWDFGITINLKTQFLVTRAIVPQMIARGSGRIVNIASVTGPLVANPEESVYCAAKAGVLGLTRGLALDLARHGIGVNAVAPGWINTGSTTAGERAAALNTPFGRAAHPEEVGKLVCFLASDDASYITGQMIVIDGGNTIQEYKGPSELYY